MKKSKILKLFIIFIILVATILATIGVTRAGQTINGTTYTESGGSYHKAFQSKHQYHHE